MESSGTYKAGVLVVSDRIFASPEQDVSGSLARALLRASGYEVAFYELSPNDPAALEDALRRCLSVSDVCVSIGGTGPSSHDITVDVALRMSDRLFPGFGEAFRRVTFDVEGPAKAIASRTELLAVGDRLILCLPGSPKAVELGIRLFVEAGAHILRELRRRREEPHE